MSKRARVVSLKPKRRGVQKLQMGWTVEILKKRAPKWSELSWAEPFRPVSAGKKSKFSFHVLFFYFSPFALKFCPKASTYVLCSPLLSVGSLALPGHQSMKKRYASWSHQVQYTLVSLWVGERYCMCWTGGIVDCDGGGGGAGRLRRCAGSCVSFFLFFFFSSFHCRSVCHFSLNQSAVCSRGGFSERFCRTCVSVRVRSKSICLCVIKIKNTKTFFLTNDNIFSNFFFLLLFLLEKNKFSQKYIYF